MLIISLVASKQVGFDQQMRQQTVRPLNLTGLTPTMFLKARLLTFGKSRGEDRERLPFGDREPPRRRPSAGGSVSTEKSCQESRERSAEGGDGDTGRSSKCAKVAHFIKGIHTSQATIGTAETILPTENSLRIQ